MKKASGKTGARRAVREGGDEMRARYDFRGGVRGKYAAQYAEGTNLVLLEPDVAARFTDAASVNRALRALLQIADETKPRRRRRSD